MIYLGSDHGGFDLKEKIKKWLTRWEYSWEDMGNTVYDNEDNYPEFAHGVARRVAEQEAKGYVYPMSWNKRSKGILCCRSAVGMVIAANKVKGVRACAAFTPLYAKQTRLHNDANVLALGADFTEEPEIKKIVKVWLETEFSGEERHVRRIKMIEEMEGVESRK